MLRAIAKENDLTKTTLQHVKSVLSIIFTYAKNEGAIDGTNAVDGVLIPRHAKEPGETHAYDHNQVLQILEHLPLLEKSRVQARIEELRKAKEDQRQLEFRFGDYRSVESPAQVGFLDFSPGGPPFGHQIIAGSVVSYSK